MAAFRDIPDEALGTSPQAEWLRDSLGLDLSADLRDDDVCPDDWHRNDVLDRPCPECGSEIDPAWVWYDPPPAPPADPNDRQCFCPDCIRCGCGIWERHHTDLGGITPVTTPKETR